VGVDVDAAVGVDFSQNVVVAVADIRRCRVDVGGRGFGDFFGRARLTAERVVAVGRGVAIGIGECRLISGRIVGVAGFRAARVANAR
jgi:hypothetical protein